MIESVEGLRADLGGFDDVRKATVSMDKGVEELSNGLDGLNALLDRYPRLLGQRPPRSARAATRPTPRDDRLPAALPQRAGQHDHDPDLLGR